MNAIDRRDFLKTSALGASAPAVTALSENARQSASGERIGVGLIGCGGMGQMNLIDFQRNPEVAILAVCDVFGPNAERARQVAGNQAQIYGDYRQVLERKDIQAVIIATPDHWHPLMAVDACDAGKDVYVEKPVSYCIREGRLMVEAARRNRRIVQVGIQQRSGSHFQRAVQAVREGRIGTVHYAQCWNHYQSSPSGVGNPADADPPADLDWDRWLGPAPKVRYNPARRNFRLFFDYAGGQLTDWGTHLIDIVLWAMDAKAPLSATASGGKLFMRDCRDTPDTLEVIYEFPGFLLRYSTLQHSSYGHNGDPGAKPFGSYGIILQGTLGTLFVDRAGYGIIPQMTGLSEKVSQSFREAFDDLSGVGMYYTSAAGPERGTTSLQHLPHVRNFLDCVKSRELPRGDIEIGHRSTSTCHLGNIALKTGTKILWDGEAEKITNSAAANALLTRQYRAPWRLPGL
jgi:predicted dehydrogenase